MFGCLVAAFAGASLRDFGLLATLMRTVLGVAVVELVARGVEEGYLAPRTSEQLDGIFANGHGAFVEGRYLAGIAALVPHDGCSEIASVYTLTRFVGQEEELALLAQDWRHACEQRGQVVQLAAEPGMGKSRLAQEFRSRIEHDAARHMTFRCSPYHRDSAFYPVIQVLLRALEFDPAYRTAQHRRDLATEVMRDAVNARWTETHEQAWEVRIGRIMAQVMAHPTAQIGE